jgi:hypothetical protein
MPQAAGLLLVLQVPSTRSDVLIGKIAMCSSRHVPLSVAACFALLVCVAGCRFPAATRSSLSISTQPVASPTRDALLPTTELEPPEPDPGKASVSGILHSFCAGRRIPGTVFYLTPASDQTAPEPPTLLLGPRPEEGDIRGVSGDAGEVTLGNVPPGRYYLAVWAPYKWVLVVQSEGSETPRVIELRAGEQKSLGLLQLCWP